MAYLLLYIDDIILTTSSEPLRQSIMSSLNAKYAEAIIARAGTLDYGLHLYKLSTGTVTLYTDANWADCPDTRKSTLGFCVFLGDNLISWSSKRQATIYRSSAEAEYRGVANVVSEACWLRNLLLELHHPLLTATIVYCDNVSAIYLSGNPVQHQKSKDVELDIHFVREK
ncbi:transmembrane signal receptor [Lithospermum erythrorhizon]|uniref:Transmembrane signal receptor n=1 Tax=Lithospermum erythrorhizon TaxID=34254 RepID=A0AAV3NLC2_LITER